MAYLSQEALLEMGFKSLGENVMISDKASIYDADRISIGSNSRIDDFCTVSGKVDIGMYVHLASYSMLAGGQKGIAMGDFSGLAYYVQIFSQSDDYLGETMTNPTVPKAYKKEIIKRVTIGRHVIIGAGSIVMPGVDLAEGCSVGAMTLVNKSTDPWGVYIGNPARRVRERKKDLLELEKKFLAELD